MLLSVVGEDLESNAFVRMGCMVKSEPTTQAKFSFVPGPASRYEPRAKVPVRICVSV